MCYSVLVKIAISKEFKYSSSGHHLSVHVCWSRGCHVHEHHCIPQKMVVPWPELQVMICLCFYVSEYSASKLTEVFSSF